MAETGSEHFEQLQSGLAELLSEEVLTDVTFRVQRQGTPRHPLCCISVFSSDAYFLLR